MKNEAAGKVFYGLHFYPGVARYEEPDQEPFQIFLNENTIREMSPTMVGKPVYVQHVDEVPDSLDELKSEADGWVIDSFFNQADGKTWCKFIVVSKDGLNAIARKFKLSNSYRPLKFGKGGLWNGLNYDKEVLAGEFDHLALVDDPRYSESVILTPEEFKTYNEEQVQQLKKLSNSKSRGKAMLSFFKRQKVDNSADFEDMIVELPKTKKAVPLMKIINEYDKIQNLAGFADSDHMVKLHDGSECSVGELVKKHKKAMNDIEDLKKAHEKEGEEMDEELHDEGDEKEDVADSDYVDNDEESLKEDMEDVGDRGGDVHVDKHHNDEDDEDTDQPEDEEHPIRKNKKHKNAVKTPAEKRAAALRLKNANLRNQDEPKLPIQFTIDAVARGKQLYGRSK